MKPLETTLVQSVNTSTEQHRMQIDTDSMAHLMAILTDLYSDPIMAVIREYSTNARDSHIDAGNPDPIKVTLPTAMNATFTVQDFGIGLNVDDLRDIYSMYGKSTKRDSDEATGMLGLGCKSGLTYTLTFGVTAIKNGVKTVASVGKDSDGVGTIRILDTVTTAEPNGVTVQIPVKSHDVQLFQAKALEFYRYWREGTVEVDGKEPTFYDNAVWLDPDVCVLRDQGLSQLVMGGVPYPFKPTINHSVVAWIPMGSVHFTPSREALHFTRRTEETIETLNEYVSERFLEVLHELLDKAVTPYEEMKLSLHWNYSYLVRSNPQLAKKSRGYQIVPTRPVWQWGHRYNNAASKIEGNISGSQLVTEDQWIITDFPHKHLGPTHKERIEEYGMTKVLVFPDGTDMTLVEGRKNVVSWQDVLDATVKFVPSKRIKTKTQYTWVQRGLSTTDDLIPDSKGPIVYYTRSENYRNDYPEAQICQIYSHQVDRFRRLHPKAVHFSEYKANADQKAADSLTEGERIFMFLQHGILTTLTLLGKSANKIHDKDLVRICNAAMAGTTPAILRVRSLYAQQRVKKPKFDFQAVLDNYPLLSAVTARDVLLPDLITYINAKFKEN